MSSSAAVVEPAAATLVALIGLCLVLEAFFTGAEVSFVSADRGRIRRRADAGSAAARRVARMMERPERVLSATLIGSSLSVVTAAFMANELCVRTLGPGSAAWGMLVMIPLILLGGQIIPKSIARRHADRVAPALAWPLTAAMAVLAPLVWAAAAVARLAVRPFHRRARRLPFVTREELDMVLQAQHRLSLERDEASLIRRMLNFADARAREHMTPLVDVASLSSDATLHEAATLIKERGFSRVPIYTGRPDNITGIVEAMDLIDAPSAGGAVSLYTKKPLYVPETASIDRLLDEFRRLQQEMAIVVDEYGTAVGVLTLEDIIEQIVGDIMDEFDRPGRSGIERAGGSVLLVDGRVKLDALCAALDMELPREGYETAAGLVAHLFQKVPRAGESLTHEGLRITVLDASPRAVRRVRIEKAGAGPGA